MVRCKQTLRGCLQQEFPDKTLPIFNPKTQISPPSDAY